MHINFRKVGLLGALALASVGAQAGQVLNNGGLSIGVSDLGSLGYNGVGLNYAGVGDAITPGCLCEGWGASAGGISGWSANENGGNQNVSLVNFTGNASSATSTVAIGGTGLQVSQTYGASASGSLFKVRVTLTNTSDATITDARYSRSMDWDIPPTAFDEFVTLQGWGATNLLYSSDDGFATPDPMSSGSTIMDGTENQNFSKLGPEDHGAFLIFGFGDLDAGESVSFDIFYGAAGNEAGALAALGAVGAEVYSLGYSMAFDADGNPIANTDSATYIFGFAGVGGNPLPPVPEPETYALMLLGLGVTGWAARRQRKAA